ncbi:MAG: hypothetical protein OEV78_00470 [Spirochaetia bacterium]|nr:hypothetical protein [Spirochaetia bacterium]
MLGITCALYDEAFELIKISKRQKNNSISYYSGTHKGIPFSLFLTKPGLRKNTNQFMKWLKINHITELLQTGFCGALSNLYRPGDVCQIKHVLSINKITEYNQPSAQYHFTNDDHYIKDDKSHSLLTVNYPVLTIDERDSINDKYTADFIDMEAWHICNLLNDNFPEVKSKIIKIVGDVPGEEPLMRNEIQMRTFFTEHSFKNRVKISLKTGISFFELYYRKRMLQKTLKTAVLNYMETKIRNN